jgi:hypothetical protein
MQVGNQNGTKKWQNGQHKIPVTVFKHKVCVAVTQTFLECRFDEKVLHQQILLSLIWRYNQFEVRSCGISYFHSSLSLAIGVGQSDQKLKCKF